MREILNISNKRCTIVHKQLNKSFSCKLNCTKVEQTATKLHKSPDETDRNRSRSLLQMRDSDSESDSTPVNKTMLLMHYCATSNSKQRSSVRSHACTHEPASVPSAGPCTCIYALLNRVAVTPRPEKNCRKLRVISG